MTDRLGEIDNAVVHGALERTSGGAVRSDMEWLIAELKKARSRIEELRQTFRHQHVAVPTFADDPCPPSKCDCCGLGPMDPVHAAASAEVGRLNEAPSEVDSPFWTNRASDKPAFPDLEPPGNPDEIAKQAAKVIEEELKIRLKPYIGRRIWRRETPMAKQDAPTTGESPCKQCGTPNEFDLPLDADGLVLCCACGKPFDAR